MASSASDPAAAAAAVTADAAVSAAAAHRRPLVGVTTYMQDAAWGVWSTEAVVLPAEYVRMVVTAGAVPVLLPPHGTDTSVLDALDGLILTGGADVGPDRYGAQPHPRTQAQPWRDDHEFALFAAARDRASRYWESAAASRSSMPPGRHAPSARARGPGHRPLPARPR